MQLIIKVTAITNNTKLINKLIYIVLSIAFLFVLCNRIYKITLYTPDIGGIESSIIRKIQLLFLDKSLLYTNPQNGNFEITQYTPLYFYFTYFFAKLFSIGMNDIEQLFVLNRIVCLVLNLLTLLIVAKICTKLLGIKGIKCLAIIVIFFGIIQAPYWGRMDSLGLFFFAWFIHYTILYTKANSNLHLATALLFLVFATLTKQNFVVYFLPILLLYRKNNIAIILTICSIALLTTILYIFYSKYPYLFHNIVLGVNNGYSLFIFWQQFIVNYFIKDGLLYIFMIGLLGYSFITKRTMNVIGHLFLFSIIISLLSAFKLGASPSYFTESIFLGLLYLFSTTTNKLYPIFITYSLGWIVTQHLGFIFQAGTQNMSSKFKDQLNDERLVFEKIKGIDTNGNTSFYTNVFGQTTFLGNLFLTNQLFPQKDIVFNCAMRNKSYPYFYIQPFLEKEMTVNWYVKQKNNTADLLATKFKAYQLIDSTKYYYIYKK